MTIRERFEKFDNEFLKFELVANKVSQRADLHAMVLLDRWFPSSQYILSAAWHDEVSFNIQDKEIESLTDEQIQELVRCGVKYSDTHYCLTMFV